MQREERVEAPYARQALLAEISWVQRLARGLVGESAADDLTQEVLVAALQAQPPFSRARLRGWLRIVARRVAGRQHSRGRARHQAERKAARSEAVTTDTGERLRVYRRLVAAIEQLEEPYRTALLLRFLEERSPSAFAAEVGLTPSAARKRVSRGLALLRARLGGEFGLTPRSSRNPLAALFSFRIPWRRAPRGTSTAALLASMNYKTILGVLAVLALASGALLVWRGTDRSAGEPTTAGDDGLRVHALANQASEDQGSPRSKELAEVEVQRQSQSRGAGETRLSVRIAGGESAAGARAAFAREDGVVTALALDASGSALLPREAQGQRLFASAPGFGLSWARAPLGAGASGNEDFVLTLMPELVLRGQLVEDGGLPRHPVLISVSQDERILGAKVRSRNILASLVREGLLPVKTEALTRRDGSFAVRGLTRGAVKNVSVPITHALLQGAGGEVRARAQYLANSELLEPLVLHTLRGPTLRGRLMQATGGGAVEGRVVARVGYEEGSGERWSRAQSDVDGVFELVPLNWVRDYSPRTGNEHLFNSLQVTCYTDDGWYSAANIPLQHLPWNGRIIDLGPVVVERGGTRVRVVNPEGAPVSGAAVGVGDAVAITDEAGEVRLAIARGERVRVLAAGYALMESEGYLPPDDPGQALVLQLSPGVALRIMLVGATELEDWGGTLSARLSWSVSPFEHYATSDVMMPWNLHMNLQSERYPDFRWMGDPAAGSGSFSLVIDDSLATDVHGLRPGSEFRVAVVDSIGQELIGRELSMPVEGALPTDGLHLVELNITGEGCTTAGLHVAVHDPSGDGIAFVELNLYSDDGEFGCSFSSDERGRFDLPALASRPFGMRVSAPGFVTRVLKGLDPSDLPSPFSVELLRSRDVVVVVEDEAGVGVLVDEIELQTLEGWRSPHTQIRSSRQVYRGVPKLPLEIKLRICTHSLRRSVAVNENEVRIVVPTLGRVVFEFDEPPADALAGKVLHFELEPLGASLLEPAPRHDAVLLVGEETEFSRFDRALLPGRYRVRLTIGPQEPKSFFIGATTPLPATGEGTVLLEQELEIEASRTRTVRLSL